MIAHRGCRAEEAKNLPLFGTSSSSADMLRRSLTFVMPFDKVPM